MQENKKKVGGSAKTIFTVVILVLVAATLFAPLKTNGHLSDNALIYGASLNMHQVNLPYSEIESVAYDEAFVRGNRAYGVGTMMIEWGSFNNTALGKYDLCAVKSVPACIIVKTKEGKTYAFNIENAQRTKEFYESLSGILSL